MVSLTGLTAFPVLALAGGPGPDGGRGLAGSFFEPLEAEISFTVSEFQPDIRFAGRINGIAIHPLDEDVVIVGTERGGLFQSRDGGLNWTHVDTFPEWWVQDVAYDPYEPDIVLATTAGRSCRARGGGGGIWRSTDGGATWSRPPSSVPEPDPTCPLGAGAHKIAFDPKVPKVFVTTDCGIARSSDRGETWMHSEFPLVSHLIPAYVAVTALGDGRIVAAGRRGIVRSETGGETWSSIPSAVGSVASYQALARSPYYRDDVYVINDRFELHISEDAGQTWRRQKTGVPASGAAAGGFEFVRVVPKDRRENPRTRRLQQPGLDLYVGNRLALFRSHARRWMFNGFRPVYSVRGWTRLSLDHGDTRDLAFFRDGRPAFLATDGGFHRTSDDGASWRLSGSGLGGLNALQLYEVAGQRIDFPTRRHDLYIGTQDNYLWSSDDTGRTWPYSYGSEGWSIFLEPRVEQEDDSLVNCSTPYNDYLTEANFRNCRSRDPLPEECFWPDAPADDASPVLIGPRAHVQQTGPRRDSPPGEPYGLSLTENLGQDWTEVIDDFGVQTIQVPQVSRYGARPVLYQGYRWGTDARGKSIFRLARISGVREIGTSAVPVFPAMKGFGTIGVHNHQFIWSLVFGVDPQDPMHLLAADAGRGMMMRSTDGGNIWTPLAGLTDLMKQADTLQFTVDLGGASLFSLATAIGFCPRNPNLILVGAAQGGLYFSADRGESWRFVPGSEGIPSVTSFHWQSPATIYVSTFGRGLWRLATKFRLRRSLFEAGCGKCTVFDLAGEPAPWVFDRAVLAFDGRLTDAKANEGLFESFSVTPGTTTILYSDIKGDSIGLPEDRSEPGSFEGLEVAAKLAAQGLVVRGLTFSQGVVSGVVVSEEEVALPEPGPFLEFKDEGEPTPGNEGVPSIQVTASRALAGIPVAVPWGVLDLTGRRFVADRQRPAELLLDGRPLEGVKVRVRRKDGSLRARVHLWPLRLRPGIHTLTMEQWLDQKNVLRDAVSFGVRHIDTLGEPRPKRPSRRK